jgi:hypothetical protein
MVQSLGKVILDAEVNGVAFQKHVFTTPGEHIYSAKIPPAALQGCRLRIEFAVEEAFSFGAEERELGVLVNLMGRSPVSLLCANTRNLWGRRSCPQGRLSSRTCRGHAIPTGRLKPAEPRFAAHQA